MCVGAWGEVNFPKTAPAGGTWPFDRSKLPITGTADRAVLRPPPKLVFGERFVPRQGPAEKNEKYLGRLL